MKLLIFSRRNGLELHIRLFPVKNSRPDIGTWQSVFLMEPGGVRTRSVVARRF